MGKNSRRFWFAIGITLLGVFFFFSSASAHAGLVRSEPANNTILGEAPQEVRLWFNEAVSAQFSAVTILDINGQVVKPVLVKRDEQEAVLLIAVLPELSNGVYSVHWKVLSEADGHFTQGLIVFGIGEGNIPNVPAIAQGGRPIPWLEVALRWLNYLLLGIIVGVVGVGGFLLDVRKAPELLRPFIRQARIRITQWGVLASVGGMLIGVGFLAWQAYGLLNTLPGQVSLLSLAGQLIRGTRWGQLWILRQVSYVLLFALFFVQYQNQSKRTLDSDDFHTSLLERFLSGLFFLLVVSLAFLQALNSHAAALPINPYAAVLIDGLHFLAVGMWIGGLLVLILALFPLIRRPGINFKELAQFGWGRFGGYAAVSVGIISATGILSASRQVASLDALLFTLYGRALVVKVLFVMVVGVFGLTNSMLLHPHLAAPLGRWLRRPSGWTPLSLRQLPLLVSVEAAFGLCVLVIASLVTASPPARGLEWLPSPRAGSNQVTQMADDLLVSLSAQPNLAGPNIFTVRAYSTRRPPPGEIMRVILRFSYQEQDLGVTSADTEILEPGVYRLGGNYLSIPGTWKIDVVIRRKGIDDSVASFSWTVGSATARTVVVSNRPLAPVLSILGLLLLSAVLLFSLGWAIKQSFRGSIPRKPVG